MRRLRKKRKTKKAGAVMSFDPHSGPRDISAGRFYDKTPGSEAMT